MVYLSGGGQLERVQRAALIGIRVHYVMPFYICIAPVDIAGSYIAAKLAINSGKLDSHFDCNPDNLEYCDTEHSSNGIYPVHHGQIYIPYHLKNKFETNPKHIADIVKLWILYNVPKQLRTPPHSPDLNLK